MHTFISRLIHGDAPQVLGQELRQFMPELDALGHRKPDLEELLEVHQQSFSRKPAVSIMPTCRYTLAPEASVLALEDIEINTSIYRLLGFPV